jgi:hypothetical protein
LRILESTETNAEEETRLYPLLVLQAWFLPLQGLINLLVYARPKYLKCQREFHGESRLWAFRRALYGKEIRPTKKNPKQIHELPVLLAQQPQNEVAAATTAPDGTQHIQLSQIQSIRRK